MAVISALLSVFLAIWFCYVAIPDQNDVPVTVAYFYRYKSPTSKYPLDRRAVFYRTAGDSYPQHHRERQGAGFRIARGNLKLGRELIRDLLKINPRIVLDDATKTIFKPDAPRCADTSTAAYDNDGNKLTYKNGSNATSTFPGTIATVLSHPTSSAIATTYGYDLNNERVFMLSPTGGVVDPFRAYQVSTSTGAPRPQRRRIEHDTLDHGEDAPRAADPIGAMEMDDVEQVGLEVYPAERFPAQ